MSDEVNGAIITTVGLIVVTGVNFLIWRLGYLKETTKEILTKNRIKWISEVRQISIDLCSEIIKLRFILDGNDSKIKELELNEILNNIINNKESLSMYFNSKQSYDEIITKYIDSAIYDLESIITSRIRIANIRIINSNVAKITQNNEEGLNEKKEYFQEYLNEIYYLNAILQRNCKFHKFSEKFSGEKEEGIIKDIGVGEAIIKDYILKSSNVSELDRCIDDFNKKIPEFKNLNNYNLHILTNSGLIINRLYLNLTLMLKVYLKIEWERVKKEPFIKLKKCFFKRKIKSDSNNWNEACLEAFREQFNDNKNSYYIDYKELFIQRNIYSPNASEIEGFNTEKIKDEEKENKKEKEELGKVFDSITAIYEEELKASIGINPEEYSDEE